MSTRPTKRTKTTRRRLPLVLRVPKGLGLPKMIRNTHRFNLYPNVTMAGTGLAQIVFYANGMFQPQAGATTHQPHYYDQFTALYDHYRVISSKISARVYTRPDTYAYTMTLFIDDDTTPSVTTQNDAQEREGARFFTQTGGMTETVPLSLSWNAKTAFGVKATNDSMFGSASTNPSENQCFVISMVGTPSANYVFQVFIEYTAEWTELATVGSS